MEKLKELRSAKGMTQSQLGEYIGAKKSAVCLWESGKRQPDQETLVRLAAFFSVTVDYLLGNDVPGRAPAQEKTPANGPYYQQVMAKAKAMNVEELKRLLRIMDAVEEGR